jgi:UDP-N-acetylmuramoyl-tripeptide--D-alanyl-D-alanine ligase
MENIYEKFLQCSAVSIDTRNCPKDAMFIGIKGANFDGNTFVEKALEQGCKYAITDNAEIGVGNPNIIHVQDSLKTLQDLAHYHRMMFDIPVIGITGTNGKTTSKELISTVLSKEYNVLYTQGNLNNHIGVPLTLLRLNRSHNIAVVEMGANHPKEIEFLCKIARPNYGIITNVGKAHLEGFGSFEGVKKTKGELYDFIKSVDGKIFLHSDNPHLCEMVNSNTELVEVSMTEFANALETIKYGESEENFVSGSILSCTPYINVELRLNGNASGEKTSYKIETNLIGDYNLSNILSAACIGRYFGVMDEEIVSALQEYTPTNNRSQCTRTEKNTLIVDAYNANPTSMEAALKNFSKIDTTSDKVLILGDMKELGEDSETEHQKVLALIQSLGFTKAYFVGSEFAKVAGSEFSKCFENVESLAEYLTANPISDSTILIKGSNSTRLTKIVPSL